MRRLLALALLLLTTLPAGADEKWTDAVLGSPALPGGPAPTDVIAVIRGGATNRTPMSGLAVNPQNQAFAGVSFPFVNATIGNVVRQSNAGVMMNNLLPPGLQRGMLWIVNTDATALMTIDPGIGATLDVRHIVLGPGQGAQILSNGDGVNWYGIIVPRLTYAPNLVMYANSVTGSDGNNCLAAVLISNTNTGPCQSTNHAYNTLLSSFDGGATNPTILSTGNFGPTNLQTPFSSSGVFTILEYTNGSTVTSTDDNYAFFTGYGARVVIQGDGATNGDGVTFSSQLNDCIKSSTESIITVSGFVNWKPLGGNTVACGNADMYASEHGHINTNGSFHHEGTSNYLYHAAYFGLTDNGGLFTFSNSPHFNQATVNAEAHGIVGADDVFSTGSSGVTGERYQVFEGGLILGVHGNLTYFPGNQPGESGNGGIYESN